MPTLIMALGLPGSGKSYHGEALRKEGWVIVNKDDIRIALGFSRGNFNRENEYAVLDRRDHLISEALQAGLNVYSSDTNFGRKHEPKLRELAKKFNAKFEVKSFTHIPVETCIERDSKREGDARVGENVIRGMCEQHIKPLLPSPETSSYMNDFSLPLVIQCDLDGTLCLHNGRGPYDYAKCGTDLINKPVKRFLQFYAAQGFSIIYLSGREDWSRSLTEQWLSDNDCPKGKLFMRPSGDHRKDSIVKAELFEVNISGKYTVEVVLEDRDQMVELWRGMGLTCWQVNWGKF